MATVYQQRELVHYGVKGMRWGVRRTRAQLDAAHPDATAAATLRDKASANKSTNVLSNAELQKVITRMNLEQNYARLIAGPPEKSKIKKGMSVVDTVLSLGDKGLKLYTTGGKMKKIFDELNIKRQRRLNPAIAALPPVKVKHDDILHYGVKGMRWGVRKDRDDSPNPNYNNRQRAADRNYRGRGSVKQINRKMNEGKSIQEARTELDARRQKILKTATKGANVALFALRADAYMKRFYGRRYKQILAKRVTLAATDALMRAAGVRIANKHSADKLANLRGIPSPLRPSTSRRGVYNITSMR